MRSLTPNFTFEAMTHTDHEDLQDENRAQGLMFITALTNTAYVAEKVRAEFGLPVIVHDAYRCKALNDAVGSQDHSQHMIGEAFDFHIDGPGLELKDCLKKIADSGIKFHQLLIERGCLHLGTWKPGVPNGEVAWWDKGEKVVYRAAV